MNADDSVVAVALSTFQIKLYDTATLRHIATVSRVLCTLRAARG